MHRETNDNYSKTSLIIFTLGSIALLGIITYYGWPFLSDLYNQEKLKKLMIEVGAWAPLLYILLQIAQVVIAPIPGQVVGIMGGYLFGPFWGVIYTLIGATIGFTLIFILARKLGRPFVERFVSKKVIDKFDHLTKDKGVWVFFLIFLLPAFPDDMISFIAGLSRIRIRTLILISVAGRLPGYVVLSLAGNGLAYHHIKPVIITGAILGILFVIAWWKRAVVKRVCRAQ